MALSKEQKLLNKIGKDTELEGLQGNIDLLSKYGLMQYDLAFKSTFKYAGMCAIILKYLVPYFRNKSVEDILRMIKSKYIDTGHTYGEAFQSEFPLRENEDADIHSKKNIYDLRFDIEVPVQQTDKSCRNIEIHTVNIIMDIEMQKDYNVKYPMVSRAMYYAASLLRNSLSTGDAYTNSNKVYTIWFCGKNEINNLHEDETNIWIHRYSMLRCHTSAQLGTKDCEGRWYYDPDADLMTVIMIDISKLNNNVTASSELNALRDILEPLFFNGTIEEFKEAILKHTNIDLDEVPKIRKEMTEMFSERGLAEVAMETGREAGMQAGMQAGREEMIVEQFNNLMEALEDKDKVLGILAKSLKKSKKEISSMLKL